VLVDLVEKALLVQEQGLVVIVFFQPSLLMVGVEEELILICLVLLMVVMDLPLVEVAQEILMKAPEEPVEHMEILGEFPQELVKVIHRLHQVVVEVLVVQVVMELLIVLVVQAVLD
jgi:hypothetical protein